MPAENDPRDPAPFLTKRKAQDAEQAKTTGKKSKTKAAKVEAPGQDPEVNEND